MRTPECVPDKEDMSMGHAVYLVHSQRESFKLLNVLA